MAFCGFQRQFLVLGVAAMAFAGLQRDSPWPMFGHDARRTGQSTHNAAATRPLAIWCFQTNSPVTDSPVVSADGVVYIADSDATFYALHANNGTLVSSSWPKTEAATRTAAIADEGDIYVLHVVSDSSYAPDSLLALDASTGDQKWAGTSTHPVAIGPDGTVFGVHYGDLFAYDKFGNLLWKGDCCDSSSSAPAVSTEGFVILGCDTATKTHSMTSIVSAYSVLDGSEVWTYQIDNEFDAAQSTSVTITDGGVAVFCRSDKSVYGFDASDGTLLWKFRTSEPVYAAPATDMNGHVYVRDAHRLYVLGQSKGNVKWTHDLDSDGGSAVISADGVLFVGTSAGLQAFDIHKRKPTWEYSTGEAGSSTAAIGANGMVYVGSEDGNIYAFGPTPCTAGEEASLVSLGTPSVIDCLVCPAGTYSPDGYDCLPCKAGSFSDQEGAVECRHCGEGEYSSEGATKCQVCPNFTYSSQGSATCDMMWLNAGVWIYIVLPVIGVAALLLGYRFSGAGWAFALTVFPSAYDFVSDLTYLGTSLFATKGLFIATVVFLVLSSLHFLSQVVSKLGDPAVLKEYSTNWLRLYRAICVAAENFERAPGRLFKKLYCFEDVKDLPRVILAIVVWVMTIAILAVAACIFLLGLLLAAMILVIVTIVQCIYIASWICVGVVLYHFKMLALPQVANVWSSWLTGKPWVEQLNEDTKLSNREFNVMMLVEILFESVPQLIIQGVNNTMLGYWSGIAYVSTIASIAASTNTLYRLGYWFAIRGATFDDIPPVGDPTEFNAKSGTALGLWPTLKSEVVDKYPLFWSVLFSCMNKILFLVLVHFIQVEVDQVFNGVPLEPDHLDTIRVLMSLMWPIVLFSYFAGEGMNVAGSVMAMDAFKAIFIYLCGLALTRMERVFQVVRDCAYHGKFSKESYLLNPAAAGTVFVSLVVMFALSAALAPDRKVLEQLIAKAQNEKNGEVEAQKATTEPSKAAAEVPSSGSQYSWRQVMIVLLPVMYFIALVFLYTITFDILDAEAEIYEEYNGSGGIRCEDADDWAVSIGSNPFVNLGRINQCILGLYVLEAMQTALVALAIPPLKYSVDLQV